MARFPRSPLRLAAFAWLALGCSPAEPEEPVQPRRSSDDTYLAYVSRAPEFRRVRQDPAVTAGRWDTWLYMPWRYRWTIGTGEAGGRLCQSLGINGAVSDHAQGPLDWFARWGLRFYNDHTAGRGDLYLEPGGFEKAARDPRSARPRPLDGALLAQMEAKVASNVRALRRSPGRVAYALDDEVSWGSFTQPIAWRVHGDDAAYARWLRGYYGDSGGGAPPVRWVTPDEALAQLGRPLQDIDLSPLLDRITWNDSVWANFLGALVERCNREDPSTPCGIVGGQAPSLWGGYDYAKLAGKVQFIEAYDLASSQEILRWLAPAIPRVTTHFHDDRRGVGNDVWLAWHHFAHGNRGMIAWVDEGWFADARPRPWLERFAPTLRELGGVQGPKMAGARPLHDGIALYYSHPSIQVSWVLDSEPHGATWPNRNDDHRLGTSHNVRRAWELLLADAGLRYRFLAYDEVVRRGVPPDVRVLILPACYALSDVEARRLRAFVEGGGTVIADFAAGLFDPHGRGRERGVLDDLFGVSHDGGETREDFFGGRLWVETDQDAGYGYRRYRELLETVRPRLHEGFAVAERRLPVGTARRVGRGQAVYLNLSPQRYLMFRQEGAAGPERARPFLDPILAAGVSPWIEAAVGGEAKPRVSLEVTAWSQGGRTLVFVLQNVAIGGGSRGGGGSEGLVEARVPVEVRLAAPVARVIDERTGRPLPDGSRFTFDLDTTEAVFFSFAGPPPRAGGA